MAQYRVLKKSFIGNHLREEGDIVEYDGKPGSNLEPVDVGGAKRGSSRRGSSSPSDAGDTGGDSELA